MGPAPQATRMADHEGPRRSSRWLSHRRSGSRLKTALIGLALLGCLGVGGGVFQSPASDCSSGAVADDGTVETGYGFVPSAAWGVYVQRFDGRELGFQRVVEVCACWLKTRGDRDIEFEIVFYEEVAGRPAEAAWATIPARASGVVTGVEEAGAFVAVDVGSVAVPAAPFFVGVRWNPGLDSWLFLCADQSDSEGGAAVFFREDRSSGWASVSESRDPIFDGHRAVLIRAGAERRADHRAGPATCTG